MVGRTGSEPWSSDGPARELRVLSDDGYPDWEAVYRDNVSWVYGLMFTKVGNRPDAEDLTAEVFMTALKPLRVSASVPEVRAYLRATARTVLAGYWRTLMGREITTIDDDLPEDAPDPVPPDSGAAERARAVLDALPDRYRRILELRFLQGLSVREAANTLGVTVANAKVLQHRALQMAARPNAGGAR
ncbi:RNA polymerase sigma factor [Nocardia pseudobrasiliensis]|uniref:RNA polymerase sigma-70 factor (ECF subfamily) n=1 Tax=Nocardia pseudobrasiliensis TaxID=45979 RepID=A0A370ID44_9NOCA|nr:RNA polymerase sigma factor [Nocardia pseudobrasiliensis]RDI68031.1 RNA polymerase sigma-70 factor (ECF subfamily) [Nocardia pseudobrasiliensis]